MNLGLAVVAAASLLVAPALAAARNEASEGRDSAPKSRVVEIRVSGDNAALSRVRLTAGELLQRLEVEFTVKAIDEPETTSDEPQPMVIAYIDLRNPSAPSIDIEDGASRQELTRRTLKDVSSLETGVEAIIHVLYLAVESRLQVGAPAPAPAPAPTAPAPQRKPAPPRPTRSVPPTVIGFDLGPMFRLSSLGASRFVPGGGLVLEPRVDIGRSRFVGLQVTGVWHATSQMTFERGEAEVRPMQVRFVPTLDLPISTDVSLCLGFGAGLDVLQVEPTQAPDVGVASRGESAFDPALVAHVGARFPIAGRAFLTALASLDLDLAPTSFVVREGAESRTLLALPRLRGGFSLALSFAAAGVRRFAAQATEP